MSERLFVYGTLHPDRAPAEIADAVRALQLLGGGTIRGRLYQLEGFPGWVREETAGTVRGHVFVLPNDSSWSRLDAYEGFDPGKEAESLFLRQKVSVAMDDGRELECWMYAYNGPLPRSLT